MVRARSNSQLRKLLGGFAGILAAMLLTAPLTAAPRHLEHHKDAKLEIMDLEQQWRSATLNGDASAMDKLLSDDFVGISWTGQVNNKMSQLDRLRTRHLTISRMDISDLKVKIVGAVAIVTSSAQIEGTNDGNPMSGTFRYTRIYQQQPSGDWKMTNFEATRVPNGARRRGRQQMPPPPEAAPPQSAATLPPPNLAVAPR
jgi:ketosteroid isomerase-like protein